MMLSMGFVCSGLIDADESSNSTLRVNVTIKIGDLKLHWVKFSPVEGLILRSF